MRTIERTTQFKRDFKRELKGKFRNEINELLAAVLIMLAKDTPLPDKYRDHELIGDWNNHRECHIKPDLLLIYRLKDDQVLQLVRLGSHSELFQ